MFMGRNGHGQNHESIGVSINNDDSVSLLFPPMIRFSDMDEFNQFVEVLTEGINDGFKHLGIEHSDDDGYFSYGDYLQIIQDVEESWSERNQTD